MRKIWDYISIRTNFTLSTKQVMATMVSMLGVFHSCLLFFFLIFGIMPLVFLNFCSVALYILCGSWVYQGRNPRKIFNIVYIEILINATISSLIQLNPDIDFRYRRSVDGREFELDTRQLREILSGVPLNTPEVTVFIADFLKENTTEIIETI